MMHFSPLVRLYCIVILRAFLLMVTLRYALSGSQATPTNREFHPQSYLLADPKLDVVIPLSPPTLLSPGTELHTQRRF